MVISILGKCLYFDRKYPKKLKNDKIVIKIIIFYK